MGPWVKWGWEANKKTTHANRTLDKFFCRRHAMRFNAISLATEHSSRPIRPYKHVRVQRIECVVVVNGVNCSTRSVMKALSISLASALFFFSVHCPWLINIHFMWGLTESLTAHHYFICQPQLQIKPHTLLLLWFCPILIDLMPHCHWRNPQSLH